MGLTTNIIKKRPSLMRYVSLSNFTHILMTMVIKSTIFAILHNKIAASAMLIVKHQETVFRRDNDKAQMLTQ